MTVTVNQSTGGGSNCISLGDQCSGNSSEVNNYTLNLSSGGNRTVKLTYRAHEGPATLRMTINGTLYTVNVPQMPLSYGTYTLPGTYPFNAGNNSISLSSGGGYMCFRTYCAGSSGGRVGVAEEPAVDSPELTVSPNPNGGEFEARFFVEPGRNATLSVTDMLGRQVWRKSLVGEGTQSEKVRLPEQAVGTYILLLDKEATNSNVRKEFKRVIVVK